MCDTLPLSGTNYNWWFQLYLLLVYQVLEGCHMEHSSVRLALMHFCNIKRVESFHEHFISVPTYQRLSLGPHSIHKRQYMKYMQPHNQFYHGHQGLIFDTHIFRFRIVWEFKVLTWLLFRYPEINFNFHYGSKQTMLSDIKH